MLLNVLYESYRGIRATPATAVAVLIVLTTTFGFLILAFAITDPFLSRPLPYKDPAELVFIRVTQAMGASAPTLRSWSDNTHLFKDLAAYGPPVPLRFRVGERSFVVRLQPVTPNLLALLGTTGSALARTPTLGSPDNDLSVILLEHTFQRIFAARPEDQIRAQSFPMVSHGALRVDAIADRRFVFPTRYSVFPVEAITPSLDDRVNRVDSLQGIIARVDPAMPVNILRETLEATLGPKGRSSVMVTRLDDYLKQDARTLARAGAIAALLVFGVCISSVANMLIARVHHFGGELAIRHAIGAPPFRVAAVLFVELLLLVLLSCCGGLIVAQVGLSLIAPHIPGEYVRLGQPDITSRAILVVVAFGGLSMVASMMPIRIALQTCLRPADRARSRAVESMLRVRLVAIVCQTAGGTVLLLGTVLLVRSYVNLVTQNTGFSHNPLIVTTSYTIGGNALQRDVSSTVARLRGLAGVRAAGAGVGSMLDRMVFPRTVVVNGARVRVEAKRVTPGYFESVGAALRRGRALTDRDTKRSGVVVNVAFVKNAPSAFVGVRIGTRGESEIVGVVEDELNRALDIPAEPTVFYLMEDVWEGCEGLGCGQVSYVVDVSATSKEDVKSAVIRTIESVNGDVVVVDAASAQERLRGSVSDRGFLAIWITLLSTTALIVMAGGLTGIVSFVVQQRSREVAIRIALGASPPRVLAAVLREVGSTTLCGICIGLIVGAWCAKGFEHFVFGVTPNQIDSLIGTAVLVGAVAALAAMVPARRALSMSPADCLRV